MAIKETSRYAIAVFGDWADLLHALAALSSAADASRTLSLLCLPSLFDDSMLPVVSDFDSDLQQAIEDRSTLTFGHRDETMSCTAGALADHFLHRVQLGAGTVVEALSAWMPIKQATRIDADIRQRRLLLWVRLLSSQEEQTTCLTLLDARPLRVEVHDLTPIGGPTVMRGEASGAGNGVLP